MARAIRAYYAAGSGIGVMDSFTITLTYQDVGLGSPTEYTIPNGGLSITVAATIKGGFSTSVSASRTETIG